MSVAWTLLSNHGHVLVHLSRFPDARVRDVAAAVGITERSTQSILSDLAAAGFIEVERVGRRNHYKVNQRSRFRHPAESQHSIADFLGIFSA